MSMLKGLKVSSLASKCVFYRPEQNNAKVDFEALEMQKRSIPMGRTQRVDEKNGLSCLVHFLWFNGLFFVFSADDSKKPVTDWAKYLNAFERSHLALLENAVSLDSELPLARYEPLKMQDLGIFLLTQQFF